MATIDPKEYVRILKRQKVTRAEWAVLSTTGMWPLPHEELARAAARDSQGDALGTVSEMTCQEALSACIEKGWLRVVDDHVLEEIRSFLNLDKAIGPVYGLPQLGDVDFTPKGAELFKLIRKEIFGANWAASHAYQKEICSKEQLYVITKKGAERAIKEIKDRYDAVLVKEPKIIGPWRVYWWEKYSKGYRIDVETGGHENQEGE
jgi:hypothetical protein